MDAIVKGLVLLGLIVLCAYIFCGEDDCQRVIIVAITVVLVFGQVFMWFVFRGGKDD